MSLENVSTNFSPKWDVLDVLENTLLHTHLESMKSYDEQVQDDMGRFKRAFILGDEQLSQAQIVRKMVRLLFFINFL